MCHLFSLTVTGIVTFFYVILIGRCKNLRLISARDRETQYFICVTSAFDREAQELSDLLTPFDTGNLENRTRKYWSAFPSLSKVVSRIIISKQISCMHNVLAHTSTHEIPESSLLLIDRIYLTLFDWPRKDAGWQAR